MSNSLALYRKYRPQNFSEIVGQEQIVKTLTNALTANNISHAYLFCGPRGSGKTTIGRLLAKSLNCRNRKAGEYEPCGECDSCLEIKQGKAIDLIEIDAASNRGIDEIRNLKENVGFVPVKSKYKVFILDEAHQLSKDASNALLKTLEEPPAHAVFVLATTEPQKMLATIISRCQRFDFRRLKIEEISGRLEKILKQEKIDFDPEGIRLIAISAGGSIRDAETMLDQVVSFCGADNKIEKKEVEDLLGLADREKIIQFISRLIEKQAKEAVELINKISFQGADLLEFTKTLNHYLRELLLLKIDPRFQGQFLATLNKIEQAQAKKWAEALSLEELRRIIETFTSAEQKIRYASIPQLPLELAIVDVCLKNQ